MKLVLALVLLSLPCWATINRIQHGSNSSCNGTTCSATGNVGNITAGDTVILMGESDNNHAMTATACGDTFTAVGANTGSASQGWSRVLYKLNATGGCNSVVLSYGTTDTGDMQWIELSGVANTNAFDLEVTSTGTGTTCSTGSSGTPNASAEVFIFFCNVSASQAAWNTITSWTSETSTSFQSSFDLIEAAGHTDAQTPSLTLNTSATWTGTTVSFSPTSINPPSSTAIPIVE